MSVVFFLIAIGIIVAGGFLAAFIWSVRSGQYDDDYTPSVRILFDDYSPDENGNGNESNGKENQKQEESTTQSNKNKS
jgi:cbb3-type cytochrome oxidase maturation protein